VATVGSLAWQLLANSSGFSAGAGKALKDTRALRGELVSLKGIGGSLTTVMGGLGVAIGGAALLGGLKSMVSESLQSVDAMGDLSDRLGVATERLTGLGYAAQLNGSSAEALNDSLDTVSKTIGILNEKGGRNAKVLGAMGVDIAKLSQLAPDEMFLELADAMSKLGSAQERAALAGLLKLGPDMVNVLMQGRDALEANVAEAEALGVAYSRFDADKVKRMADAWDRTGAAMKGAANEAAIGFAPIFEGLAMAAQDALALPKLIGGRATSATQQGLPNIVGVRSKEERDRLFEQHGVAAAATEAADAAEGQQKLNDEMAKFIEQLQIQADTYGMSADAAELYEMRMRGATQADIEAAQSLIDQKEKIEADKKLREDTEKARERTAREQKELFDSLKTPADRFIDDFSKITDILGPDGFVNPDLFGRALDDLQKRIEDELGMEGPATAQSTGAIRAGSIEALRAQFSGNVPAKQLKESEKQTKEQEAMRGLLETISEKIQGLAEAPG
jgi:Skp family chaperone for outer membrane proteins